MENFWTQFVITVAGSGLFVTILEALLGRFRIGRRSEQLGAWQGELEALRKIDRSSGSGAALHIAARKGVYRSIANRLVPPTFWQGLGFFIAGLLTITLSAILLWVIEPAGNAWDVARIGMGVLYGIVALLAVAMCFVRPYASDRLRAAVLAGIESNERSDGGAPLRFRVAVRGVLREQNADKWSDLFAYEPTEEDEVDRAKRKLTAYLRNPYQWWIQHSVEPDIRGGVFSFLGEVHALESKVPPSGATHPQTDAPSEDCKQV
jgi:hypothetical protein